MITIDMIGKPCPIPVVEAKKALARPDARRVTVLVDNLAAVQNLQKMANGLGYKLSHSQNGESNYAVVILAEDTSGVTATIPIPEQSPQAAPERFAGATILITGDQMGRGSEELGRILIKGFIFSLTQLSVKPEKVMFLNSGVKLVTDGSNALDDLRELADAGVDIYACGTCLNYYDLTDKLAVGNIVNMFEIAEALSLAARTVVL